MSRRAGEAEGQIGGGEAVDDLAVRRGEDDVIKYTLFTKHRESWLCSKSIQ